MAVIMFKCIHDMVPKYLQDLSVRSHNRQLRSHRGNKMPVTITCTAITQNGSFSSVGPHTWNSLPDYLTIEQFLDVFKNLKTFLFRNSYPLQTT